MCETTQVNGTVLKTKGVQLGPLSCLSCVSSSHCFETENTSVQCRGGTKWLFGGCQRMAKAPNSVEKLRIHETVWPQYTRVTDDRRQTDRQTTSHDNSRTLHCNGRLKTCFIFWQVNVFNIYGLVTAFCCWYVTRHCDLDLLTFVTGRIRRITWSTTTLRLKILQLSVPELIVLTVWH